jgi:hypothetical protein
MLLNKYAKFNAISKDDFAEELLFKIEKNVKNKRTLEDNAFPFLYSIIANFKNMNEVQALMMSDDHYKNLLVYSNKFNTLADNIDYIYNALNQHLQIKMKDERSLKEAYLLCTEVG